MPTNPPIPELPATVTISRAAELACVSVATIRNWIRTGYLQQAGRNAVTQASLDAFMSQVAGKEKLNARANKLQKDSHNHRQVSDRVGLLLGQLASGEVGEAYERSLSSSHRNREGVYYTPAPIVSDMLGGIDIAPSKTFLDPCCGSGNFIVEAIRRGVSPHNVYGFDVDPNAVAIARARIRDEFGVETEKIRVADFMVEASALAAQGHAFDLIFTNPPWGKKLAVQQRQRYAQLYGAGRSTDTTAIFMAAALQLLHPGGIVGFLVQEACFNIATFEDMRRLVLERQVCSITDYGKPFRGLLTGAQTIILKNERGGAADLVTCRFGGKTFQRVQRTFGHNPKTILNYWMDEEEERVVQRMFERPHVTLKGRAQWALGIVTGQNKSCCIAEPRSGYLPAYRGSDITLDGIKEATTFIPSNFSTFQQVAPAALYQAREKILYRFISSSLTFAYDNQQRYILNSANALIPDAHLGISAPLLTDVLNSRIMGWLFQKLFRTHKVLRGDLECLPLHLSYLRDVRQFDEAEYLQYLGIERLGDGSFRLKDGNEPNVS